MTKFSLIQMSVCMFYIINITKKMSKCHLDNNKTYQQREKQTENQQHM